MFLQNRSSNFKGRFTFRNGSELIFVDSLARIGLQSIDNYFTMYTDFV